MCFLDGKRQAYLISNVTDPKDELKANVSITLKGKKIISIYKKLNKTVVDGKEFDFTLDSGEGIFVVIE